MNKEEAIKYLKSEDWIEYSCGRSTDYIDEFDSDASIENLIDMVKKLFASEVTKE